MTATKTRETVWIDEPIVGNRVRWENRATGATGSGLYIGVALDEEDGVPYHYFVDGEIRGGAQASHGFPAEPGTPVTDARTPTDLIVAAETHDYLVRTSDGKIHVPTVQDVVVDTESGYHVRVLVCPVCKAEIESSWADDGDADRADYWECCVTGCEVRGELVQKSDPTRTQNGVPVVQSDDRRLAMRDVDGDGFMETVERAWYELAKGELWLSRDLHGEEADLELRNTVANLGQTGREAADAAGTVIDDEELAKRIAVALSVVMYGEQEASS